ALGFSGSGLFGHTQQATVEILKKLDLTVPALHTDLVTLQLHLGDLSRMCHVLGIEYVGIAAIPMELRANLKAYETIAHTFNQIGENVRGEGLKFYYHNHGYGLQKQEGQIPMDIIFHETDPDLVFFEMDIYWMTAGGADPIEYLEKYGDRYRLMHLKDMKELRRFSGDGGDPGQWMELFPFMASAGEGVLDLEGIIDKALRVGVEHFFVEQDMVANPNVALKRSYDYLEKLSFS
ncbi:MAG: sugar phosphate isomerase/epimerase, partial [Saprospiraceae bacterium]|nr:sugar phosphate isomerase/epimerase [Saprospiraceae bacterium]